MRIVSQPKVNRLGDLLRTCLTSKPDYANHTFRMLVAYVKNSGVARLKPALETFRSRGGRVTATVGVDQKTTTHQGLRELLSLTDELYVYHSEAFYQTFHPKVYVLEETGVSAQVFLGSSNLTAGGLYTNYEADLEKIFDLRNSREAAQYEIIRTMLASYSNTDSECCLRVTEELIRQLADRGYLGNEEVVCGRPSGAAAGRGYKPIFGTERFAPPPATMRRERRPRHRERIRQVPILGQGFWKKLSQNDVSLTSSPGQIIIPIRFLPLFPEFSESQNMPSGARQSDVFFTVVLTNRKGRKLRLSGVRGIHYVPAPTHKRPNQELRFTFRNHAVLKSLREGDILVFRRTDDPDVWFDVVHVPSGTDKRDGVSFRTGKFGAIG